MLLGPNTGLGHNSVVIMIEAQVNYIMRCLRLMQRKGLDVIEVKHEAQTSFFKRIQEQLQPTVWQSGGCRSWYQDLRTGKTCRSGRVSRSTTVGKRDASFLRTSGSQ